MRLLVPDSSDNPNPYLLEIRPFVLFIKKPFSTPGLNGRTDNPLGTGQVRTEISADGFIF
jgi:hypothetical protein